MSIVVNKGNGSYKDKKTADKNKARQHSNNKENKKVSSGNCSRLLLDREARVHVQPGKKFEVNDAQTYPRNAMVDLRVSASPWMIPHKEAVSDGWCNGGVATNNELQVDYPRSCGSMMSEKYEEDLRNRMGMIDAVPAGCPQRPPAPWDHGRRRQQQRRPVMVRGRPLLELLSLSANFLVKGTIAVFDRKRGQIIYENYDRRQGDDHRPPPTCSSNNPQAGFTNLKLTGPYRAISADGESFAMKLNPSGPNDDESDGAGELWKCNICEADDGVVESIISTDEGKILVTYAVLSNAVEATVQVNLDWFAADTHVYGKITAHIPDFDDEDTILLLSHPAGEPLQLIPSSAAAFILPLSRSIIAVRLGSSIDVQVDIYATSIRRDTAPIRFQGKLCFPFGEHTLRIHAAMGDLTVSVNITH